VNICAPKKGLGGWFCGASLLVLLSACGSAAQGPKADAGGPETLATVDGVPITSSEIETALGARLAQLEEKAYALKKEQLEELIGDRLLAAEASRRGVTIDALIDREVQSRIAAVTESDIDAFVKEHRARLPADTTSVRPKIREFLAAQREREQRKSYVDSLRAAASVDVRLKPPAVYRADVDLEESPSRGPADAPVTIVEFSDFHCPFCRSVQPTLNQVLAKYPNEVRLVYRHFPLDDIHPHARRAAEASWCANEQRRFWPFHNALYAGGADASTPALVRLARQAELNVADFESCLASGRASGPIERDAEDGARHGVTGTPGFFVNGRMLSGNQPLSAFVGMVEDELKQGNATQ
jgi:protein-disulfide isomerase